MLEHGSPFSSGERRLRNVKLRHLGTDTGGTGCPALYATDRGTFVVQGWRVTDPEAIADLIDVRENESYVEIPKTLLRYAEER
jgi:hypothetical protein